MDIKYFMIIGFVGGMYTALRLTQEGIDSDIYLSAAAFTLTAFCSLRFGMNEGFLFAGGFVVGELFMVTVLNLGNDIEMYEAVEDPFATSADLNNTLTQHLNLSQLSVHANAEELEGELYNTSSSNPSN